LLCSQRTKKGNNSRDTEQHLVPHSDQGKMPTADRHYRTKPRGKGQKVGWSDAETKALLLGVERYSVGAWSKIKDDPDFGPALMQRTTVDIKDKFRNLSTKRAKAGVEQHEPAPNARTKAPDVVADRNKSLAAAQAARAAALGESGSKKHARAAGDKAEDAKGEGKRPKVFREAPPEPMFEASEKLHVTLYDGRVRRGKEVVVQCMCVAKVQTLLELARKEFGSQRDFKDLSLYSSFGLKIDPSSSVGGIAKFDRLKFVEEGE
jgi:hypothetical protein